MALLQLTELLLASRSYPGFLSSNLSSKLFIATMAWLGLAPSKVK